MSLFLLAFSFLACWDPAIIVDPPAEPPANLESGRWEVQILDVVSASCDGVRPRDLVGQAIPAELVVSGDLHVAMNLAGWDLRGDIGGSNLFIEGPMMAYDAPGGEEPMPGEPDDDHDDEEVPPAGESESGRGSEGEGRDECESCDPEPPSSAEGWASIDAVIRSERLADGRLAVSMPECELELDVVMAFIGGSGDDPVVVDVDDDEIDHDDEDRGDEQVEVE